MNLGKKTTLLLFAVVLFSGVLGAQTKSNDVAVVVNLSAPVSELTLSEARKIFRGDRQMSRPFARKAPRGQVLSLHQSRGGRQKI